LQREADWMYREYRWTHRGVFTMIQRIADEENQ